MDKMDKEAEDFDTDPQQEIDLSPYQNPTASIIEAIRLMESCPVCGSRVHFTSFADFSRMTTHEVSRCEDCGYRAKKAMTRLM